MAVARPAFSWLAVPACLLLVAATADADDWPQFGGLKRDFSSAEVALARSWPADGPKVLWTSPLNRGFGGAATWGQEVFILDRIRDQNEALICLDLASGKELWRLEYEAPGKMTPPGARATPTVDKERVYITSPLGLMHCVDRATRRILWKADLVRDFAGVVPKWGVSQNPALHGDLVIVAPQGRGGGLVAFHKATGQTAWKSPILPGMITGDWQGSYVSPILAEIGGIPQAIMATAQGPKKDDQPPAKGVVAGVSLKDGSVLWSYHGWQCDLPIAAPVWVGDGRLFLCAAYDAGSAMVRVRKTDSGFAVEQVLKTTQCGSQIQQPLVHKDHLYIQSNGKERKEGLMCLTLDGKVLWHTTNSSFASGAAPNLPNMENGNILLADGMIYALDGATGDLRLIEASPAGFKELALARGLLGGQGMKQIWAPMALSDGKLLARDQGKLVCLDVRAGSAGGPPK
jgi:outer membrane protein assembly factor BamB